jgi:hypothetical protein
MSFRSSWIATISGVLAIAAGAPASATPITADGLTYTLFEATTSDPKTDLFTLVISGINASPGDTEGGGRYGVNSLAFNETSPKNSVTGGSMTGFKFMTGGLNAMGCDGSGNFFCFKANTRPTGPALPANSTLDLTFSLTVAAASDFNGYDPDLKIQWVGTNKSYDLVSQPLAATPVPLPAALPLLLGGLGGIAGFGLLRRRRAA